MDTNSTTIICIDIQEKLVNMLGKYSSEISSNTTKLMNAASILNIDTIITEQYPKGLGSTIASIKEIKDFNTIEKTTFSALATEGFNKPQNKNIVIFGIETHICVYQTVLDLLKEGYNVYVVADCCGSRSKFNHKSALKLMAQEGAKITTLEIVLFEFLKSSKHPNFKEIQGLIK